MPKDWPSRYAMALCQSLDSAAELRDLMRTRLTNRDHITILKHWIHAALRRYGTLDREQPANLFSERSWVTLSLAIGRLPEETRRATQYEWEILDLIERRIGETEVRIRQRIGRVSWVRLLKSLPGVGEILDATIYLEIGDVHRFPTAAHLASYAGLAPTVHTKGGKAWRSYIATGQSLSALGFVEAANAILMTGGTFPPKPSPLVGKFHAKRDSVVPSLLRSSNYRPPPFEQISVLREYTPRHTSGGISGFIASIHW